MSEKSKPPEGMDNLHAQFLDQGVGPNRALVACWDIADHQRAIGANAPLCDMLDGGDMPKRHLRHPKWLALNVNELLALFEGLSDEAEAERAIGYEQGKADARGQAANADLRQMEWRERVDQLQAQLAKARSRIKFAEDSYTHCEELLATAKAQMEEVRRYADKVTESAERLKADSAREALAVIDTIVVSGSLQDVRDYLLSVTPKEPTP